MDKKHHGYTYTKNWLDRYAFHVGNPVDPMGPNFFMEPRHRDGQSAKNLVNADWLSPEALCQRLRLQLCASGVGGCFWHFFWRKTPPAETDQDTKLDIFESSPIFFFWRTSQFGGSHVFPRFSWRFLFFWDPQSRWPKETLVL